MSSYTPLTKALAYAKEQASTVALLQSASAKLLIVTMANIPGAKDLPRVEQEKSEIIAAVGGLAFVQAVDQPNVASVMEHLGQCTVAHFACHGVSDPADPSESGLLL